MFTDVVEVKKFLTHPRFVLVDNKEDADILWMRGHFKDFRCVANLCLHVKNYLIKLIIICKVILFYINRYPIQYYPGYPEGFLLLMILPGK